MKKFRFAVSVFLLFLLPSLVFALANGEQVASSLYFFPTNIVNNQGIMIELTQQKNMKTPTDYTSLFGKTTSDGYKSQYSCNLVAFTLLNTLKDSVQTSSGAISVTITSGDSAGFYFVHDENPTKKIQYELELYTVKLKKDRDTTPKYSIESGYPKNESSTKMTHPSVDSYTVSVDPTTYTNTTIHVFGLRNNDQYPDYTQYHHVCIKIPNNSENVESGYYTATMTVTATFKEAAIGSSSGAEKSFSETITIKGYVGAPPEQSNTEFSFNASPTEYTYFIDLLDTDRYYDVVKVQLLCFDVASGEVPSATSSSAKKKRQKYKIYISSTSSYGTDSRFKFTRIGAENMEDSFDNTIYYDLYIKKGDTYVAVIDCIDYTNSGNDSRTGAASYYGFNLSDNTKTGWIGGAGPSTGSSEYSLLIYPLYTALQMSTGSSGSYRETWDLNVNLYLKVSSDSIEDKDATPALMHRDGMYSSTIYFTVVSDE